VGWRGTRQAVPKPPVNAEVSAPSVYKHAKISGHFGTFFLLKSEKHSMTYFSIFVVR